MSCCLSSVSSDNDVELSSLSEDVPETSEGEFSPYDENLELVETQEKDAAYKQILRAKKKNMICISVALLARSRPIHGMYCLNNCSAFSPSFVILNAFY